MKRNYAILILLMCNLGLSVIYADWNDITITQDTEIFDSDQYVRVLVRSINQITTVNVTGGQIGTLFGYNDSIINVTGGTFRQNYYDYHPGNNDGDDIFLAPYLYSIYVEDSSTLNYYGADLYSVSCGDESTTNVFDGRLSLFLTGDSEINITGGEISGIGCTQNFLNSECASHLSISGGTFSGKVSLIDDCVADIYGYGFVYDPDGWISDDPRIGFGLAGGQLRGFWADGTPFSIDFVDTHFNDSYSHVNLHVIPEPATFFLLALGTIFSQKKITYSSINSSSTCLLCPCWHH